MKRKALQVVTKHNFIIQCHSARKVNDHAANVNYVGANPTCDSRGNMAAKIMIAGVLLVVYGGIVLPPCLLILGLQKIFEKGA